MKFKNLFFVVAVAMVFAVFTSCSQSSNKSASVDDTEMSVDATGDEVKKCGEGKEASDSTAKCGEGKCGSGEETADSTAKCGEGKCGE